MRMPGKDYYRLFIGKLVVYVSSTRYLCLSLFFALYLFLCVYSCNFYQTYNINESLCREAIPLCNCELEAKVYVNLRQTQTIIIRARQVLCYSGFRYQLECVSCNQKWMCALRQVTRHKFKLIKSELLNARKEKKAKVPAPIFVALLPCKQILRARRRKKIKNALSS